MTKYHLITRARFVRTFLYSHRDAIVCLVLFTTLVLALTSYLAQLPGGLSDGELQSSSSSVKLSLSNIINSSWLDLPYHLIQKVSIMFFGPSYLGIRLPSLLASIATVVLSILIIKHWFHRHIAVLSGMIIATSVPIVALGRVGTPAIMVPFFACLILYSVSRAATAIKYKGLWQAATIISIFFSLYTPGSVYLVLALLVTAALHPHSRYVVIKTTVLQKVGILLLFAILSLPLFWWLVYHSTDVAALWGFTASVVSFPQLLDNLESILRQILGSSVIIACSFTAPLVGLPVLALTMAGVVRVFTHRHAVRSHVLIVWCLLMLPMIIVNPNQLLAYFLPIMLLATVGLELLIDHWYSLFPYNPYARATALLPLSILFGGMAIASTIQYTFTELYSPLLVPKFTSDYSTVATSINQKNRDYYDDLTIVVPIDKQSYYHLLLTKHKNIVITSSLSNISTKNVILLESAGGRLSPPYAINRIIVNSLSGNALVAREYVRQ